MFFVGKFIKLRELTKNDEQSFLASLHETWEKGFVFAHYWEDTCKQDYSRYLEHLCRVKNGIDLIEGHVSATLLFAFDDEGTIVGRSSIRHTLNQELLESGGHIGYGVLPSFRNLGVATEILKQSLIYCCENLKNLDKVLVTCNDDNIGSKKTILKNGGLLENKVVAQKSGPLKNRYWIKL